jgi:hypothetical protein
MAPENPTPSAMDDWLSGTNGERPVVDYPTEIPSLTAKVSRADRTHHQFVVAAASKDLLSVIDKDPEAAVAAAKNMLDAMAEDVRTAPELSGALGALVTGLRLLIGGNTEAAKLHLRTAFSSGSSEVKKGVRRSRQPRKKEKLPVPGEGVMGQKRYIMG